MGRRMFLVAVAACLLLSCLDPPLCQGVPPPDHLILQFEDSGPPAVHQVEAKIGDRLNGQWVWVPAEISRPDGSQLFQAAFEMPDARCAIFRVKRLGSDPVPGLRVVAAEQREQGHPISPFDHAFIESCTNDDLCHLPRFGGCTYRGTPYLVPGVDYVPGKVRCGFTAETTEEDATAVLASTGAPFEVHFLRFLPGLWCRVTSGDVWEHIARLEESDIVHSADLGGGPGSGTWILVTFNLRATLEGARELLSSTEGLEPDWESAYGFHGEGLKWGVIEVTPGFEFASILALEAHPNIAYAELCGVYLPY